MDKKITLTDKNNIPFTITYGITRSRRKTCAIVLKEDATVTVRLPLCGKDSDAERFLREKQFWISAKLSELLTRKQEQQAGHRIFRNERIAKNRTQECHFIAPQTYSNQTASA